MMKWATILALGLAIACSETTEDDTDTDADADADADSDSDTDTDTSLWHPLVPEEYWYLWSVNEGCGRNDRGTQTYIVMEQARIEADGSFTAREKWYHFYATGDYADDKVDTIEYTGTVTKEYSPADLGCITCEVVVGATRDIVDDQTGTRYTSDVFFMFEAQNSNDEWNEDFKTLVYYNRVKSDGELSKKREYARGNYIPDVPENTEDLYPAEMVWVGEYCL